MTKQEFTKAVSEVMAGSKDYPTVHACIRQAFAATPPTKYTRLRIVEDAWTLYQRDILTQIAQAEPTPNTNIGQLFDELWQLADACGQMGWNPSPIIEVMRLISEAYAPDVQAIVMQDQ
jgi:hypothetical protein